MNTRHRPCEPDTKRGKQRVDIVIITVPSGSLTTTLPLRNECIHVAAHTTWYARIHPDGTLLRQSWTTQLTCVVLCAVHRMGFKTASRGKRRKTVTYRFQFSDVREVSNVPHATCNLQLSSNLPPGPLVLSLPRSSGRLVLALLHFKRSYDLVTYEYTIQSRSTLTYGSH